METTQIYKVSGFILGELWVGGLATSTDLVKVTNLPKDCSMDTLISVYETLLITQTLCKYGDFQKQIGVLLEITCVTLVVLSGKEYRNEKTTEVFLGDLTEEHVKCILNARTLY